VKGWSEVVDNEEERREVSQWTGGNTRQWSWRYDMQGLDGIRVPEILCLERQAEKEKWEDRGCYGRRL
jgi:hypothetical protein